MKINNLNGGKFVRINGFDKVGGVCAFVPFEVIRALGLAVEQGCDEPTQRAQHGDLTVDWISEMTQASRQAKQENG